MKKIIMLLMAVLLISPAYAETNKKSEKALRKELKAKLKEYQKGKWEVLGSQTLEAALAKHYERLNTLGDDGHEVEGIAGAVKSKNVGKQMATNNAVITYGQEAGSTLKGRGVSDVFADAANPEAETDRFLQNYERLVQREIGDEMEHSFSIIRTNPDGTYEVRSYFIISEKAAGKARRRALSNAVKEADLASKYGNKISKFIEEGFKE